MTRFLFLVSVLIFCFAEAEEPATAPPLSPAAEHPQFDIFSERGTLRGLVELPTYSFYLGSPDIQGVAYVPNFSPRIGAQASWDDFRITATFALPIPAQEIERRGRTDQQSFLVSRYWRQYALEGYYQHYKGFYVASPSAELSVNKAERYPQLPDAEISNYGVNGYCVVDPDHYSLSAAFSQIEFQAFSGGSWLVNPFYNHLDLTTGNVFVAGSDPNSPQAAPDLKSSRLDTLGLGLGYGYTWVQERKFLVVQGILGLGGQWQQIDGSVGSDFRDRLNAAGKINVNISAGYNGKVYSYGAKLLGDSLFSSVKGTQLYSTLLNAQIFFGGRF